jgi:hypothetical protein
MKPKNAELKPVVAISAGDNSPIPTPVPSESDMAYVWRLVQECSSHAHKGSQEAIVYLDGIARDSMFEDRFSGLIPRSGILPVQRVQILYKFAPVRVEHVGGVAFRLRVNDEAPVWADYEYRDTVLGECLKAGVVRRVRAIALPVPLSRLFATQEMQPGSATHRACHLSDCRAESGLL